MIARVLAGLTALYLLFACRTSTRAAAPVSIPFVLLNNHVYLDVMLDGRGPYHFVFDSGAPFDLLDTGVARDLGLSVRPRASVGGVGNAEEPAGRTTVSSVRLGDIALANRPFVVTGLQRAIGIAEGRPIDGVIGRDVLERYVTTFDYARGTVTLGDNFADVLRSGATALPMRVRGGLPQIACQLSGVAGTCNVDTGSRLPLTVLAPFAAAHPSVVPGQLTQVGVDGYGLGGAAYGRLGKLDTLGFGAFILRDVICDFSAQTRGAFADGTTAGNIGGGVWRRFALTFDLAHDRIALRANADFGRLEDFDRSGLFLTAREGAVSVLDVRPATPAAAAGITKNDRILALDGRALGAGALPQIRLDLAGAPGTVVLLRVERDGIERNAELILRDYIGN